MIYLYVKEHTKTGLKYFGKTCFYDPYKYLGSGKYWLNHIKKHGTEFVTTCQVWKFEDQEECTRFALEFSKENNIVESNEWANLREENGVDGSVKGEKKPPRSAEHIRKLSESQKGRHHSNETKLKISKSHKGKVFSEETKQKLSIALSGKPKSIEHRNKLSIINQGKQISEETKQKLSIASTKYWAKKKSLNRVS